MSLENYYHLIFSLAQHHKYSVTEIEDMVPFERDIYVGMLTQYLDKKRKEAEQN